MTSIYIPPDSIPSLSPGGSLPSNNVTSATALTDAYLAMANASGELVDSPISYDGSTIEVEATGFGDINLTPGPSGGTVRINGASFTGMLNSRSSSLAQLRIEFDDTDHFSAQVDASGNTKHTTSGSSQYWVCATGGLAYQMQLASSTASTNLNVFDRNGDANPNVQMNLYHGAAKKAEFGYLNVGGSVLYISQLHTNGTMRIRTLGTGEVQLIPGNGTPAIRCSSTGIGLHGEAPTAQASAIADATDLATTQSALNTLLAHLRTRGDIAT